MSKADAATKEELDTGVEESEVESVADTIADAIKEIEAADETDEGNGNAAAAVSEHRADDDQDSAKTSDDAEDDATVQDQQGEGRDGDDQAADDAEADTVEPPEHWSQPDKDAFNELPAEARPLYLDARKSLERGYQQKFEALSEDSREATALREAFKPFDEEIAREGIDRVGAMRRLVAAHDLLTRDGDQGMQWLASQPLYKPKDPTGTVKAIAKAWGVDLGATDTSQADEDILDPMAKQKITALESKIADLQQHQTNTQQAQQTERQSAAQATLQSFLDATDEAGKPKHPHFEAVKTEMGLLMQVGKAATLEEAYRKAVWTDDALRADLLKQERGAQKAKDDQKAQIARNKKASRNVTGDKTGGKTAAKDRSLRDEIAAAVDDQAA